MNSLHSTVATLRKLFGHSSCGQQLLNIFKAPHDDGRAQCRAHTQWNSFDRRAEDARARSIGKSVRARVQLAWRMTGMEMPEKLRVLEWGSGDGAVAQAFRDVAVRYYGVDISETNLAEAGRAMETPGQASVFIPVLLKDAPEPVIGHLPGPIDLFLSNACFQHFPSRQYGAEVLRAVRNVAAPGCVGAVQIRYDNGHRLYRGIRRLGRNGRPQMVTTSYGLDEFWELLIETGWQPMTISRIQPEHNEADFLFQTDKL